MQFPNLLEATLLRRYKRFLADVALPDGTELTVHCPNTGAMTGCAEAGSRVWLARSDSARRKYPHTWELVETAAGLACIHSSLANTVVFEALAAGRIPELAEYPDIQPEVKYGQRQRVDFLLSGARGRAFVEVKSVTLCREDGCGLFPDAVSERGRKHLQALQRVAKEKNTRALLFFCVLHNGIEHVSAAGEIDPRYRNALESARSAGVEVLAWRAAISPQGMQLATPLEFSLDPPQLG